MWFEDGSVEVWTRSKFITACSKVNYERGGMEMEGDGVWKADVGVLRLKVLLWKVKLTTRQKDSVV